MSATASDPAPATPGAGRGLWTTLLSAWLPPGLYVAVIWWLSSQVLDGSLVTHVPFADRGVHFVEYAGLGWLIARAVQVTWGPRGMRGSMVGVLLGVALGLLDEFHQLFVPGRSAEIFDLVADTLGVCAAVGLHALWTTRLRRQAVSG
jgi:VanZ family protein